MSILEHSPRLNNIDCPFTELFSLLKRYENLSTGMPSLAYEADELHAMQQHIDNAIELLLQGLNGLGFLLGRSSFSKMNSEEINKLGFFISAITNLTEALKDLKTDAVYMLKAQDVINY